MVDKIWIFEVIGAKWSLSFWEVLGIYLEIHKVWRASV
jgi:hypothetical protein